MALSLARTALDGGTLHYIGQKSRLERLDLGQATGLDLEDLAALRGKEDRARRLGGMGRSALPPSLSRVHGRFVRMHRSAVPTADMPTLQVVTFPDREMALDPVLPLLQGATRRCRRGGLLRS